MFENILQVACTEIIYRIFSCSLVSWDFELDTRRDIPYQRIHVMSSIFVPINTMDFLKLYPNGETELDLIKTDFMPEVIL